MGKQYFNALNYTLGNEDTALETAMTAQLRPKRVFSVCGSGSRALPLINEDVEEIVIADISPNQLSLCRLREWTFKSLNHDDFLKFWGYLPYNPEDNRFFRKKVLDEAEIDSKDRHALYPHFESRGFASPLYQGKWEQTFKKFSLLVGKTLGEHAHLMFQNETMEEQTEYFKNSFPWKKWNFLIGMIGNKSVFNALLYKGSFIKKNVEETHYEYYHRGFTNIFNQMLTTDSYFLQLCVHGKIIHPNANLNEAREFEVIKKSLAKTKVTYVEDDMINAISKNGPFDFLSLSDVACYFSGDIERDFMKKISLSMSEQAVAIHRSYLRVPECQLEGLVDITEDFKTDVMKESVQMYLPAIWKKS